MNLKSVSAVGWLNCAVCLKLVPALRKNFERCLRFAVDEFCYYVISCKWCRFASKCNPLPCVQDSLDKGFFACISFCILSIVKSLNFKTLRGMMTQIIKSARCSSSFWSFCVLGNSVVVFLGLVAAMVGALTFTVFVARWRRLARWRREDILG